MLHLHLAWHKLNIRHRVLADTSSTLARGIIQTTDVSLGRKDKEKQAEEQRKKAIRAVDILFMLEILQLFCRELVDPSTN